MSPAWLQTGRVWSTLFIQLLFLPHLPFIKPKLHTARIHPIWMETMLPYPYLEFSGREFINEWRSHRSAQVWMLMCVFLNECQIQAFTTCKCGWWPQVGWIKRLSIRHFIWSFPSAAWEVGKISPFIFGDFSKISERHFTIDIFFSPEIILSFDLCFFLDKLWWFLKW